MDLQKKITSENSVIKNRPLDRSIHRKIEELLKHGKLVQAVREFPPGCGTYEAEKKPVKILKRVHSDPVKTDRSNSCIPKDIEGNKNKSYLVSRPVAKAKFCDQACTMVGYEQKLKVNAATGMQKKNSDNVGTIENVKLKSIEQKELGRNKSYLDSKTSKVKYYDPNSDAQKPEVGTDIVSDNKDNIQREKIKEAMTLFIEVYEQLRQENSSNPKGKKISAYGVPIRASKIVEQRLKWINPAKVLGPVRGVEIGDTFKFRVQLKMIGLHCQLQSGIDYASYEGRNVAISVVDSHRYCNESGSSDTLVYSGHGESGFDQKLERGNMALKNSKDRKTPVRVIRKLEGFNEVFVYDGLYTVEDYTRSKNEECNVVFKFVLKRNPGQPPLYKKLNGNK